jgi:N-acetylmuramoyl-L-alanine amidase
MRQVLVWYVLWFLGITGLYAAELNNITLAEQPGKTTLNITINGAFTHQIFTLSNPSRVVLDLKNTNLAMDMRKKGINNSLISQMRSGKLNEQQLRLVFDVRQNVHVRSVPWQSKGRLQGLHIELIQNSNKVVVARPNPNIKLPIKIATAHVKTSQTSPSRILHDTPIKVSNSPSNKYLRDIVVVLDAGHGGKDPGARGPGNSKEKYVVLAITLKLKQLIDKQPGMRAVLTRSGDYYVGLRQRLDIARKYNGDIFVSIHADAFNNPHSNGASVFALSQGGATSEAARWIAEKENYSELGGVNLVGLDDTNGVVRSVLIDLSQTATINASLQIGGRVLSQLNHFTNLHNIKVEQARFMVLKSPDIPSILVETGFISNPREEKNLASSAYQTRLSQAIFQGIKTYFWDNPPRGTRIEAMTINHFHIVKKGDTLPAIASRYHVAVKSMQSMNHLNGKTPIRLGQRLVIPTAWS